MSEIHCTFNYTVSHANGDRVLVQVSDAEAFLSQYSDELRFLRAADGVEHACLDFGWDIPDAAVGQFTMFPYSLLDRCADLRIDLEVSVYLVDAPDKRA